MSDISRVGHVVLYVSDVDEAVAFYRDQLGMEVVRHDTDRQMAFMSFGTQHHDIGLFRARGEATRGTLGLAHVAMIIDGGVEVLRTMHDRLVEAGVEVEPTDHGMTQSVYFADPDGNRLEIYCDVFVEPAEGMQWMRDNGGVRRPLDLNNPVPSV